MSIIHKYIDNIYGLHNVSELSKTRSRILLLTQTAAVPLNVFFIIFFYIHREYYLSALYGVSVYFVITVGSLALVALTKKFQRFSIWIIVLSIALVGIYIHITQGGFYKASGTLLYSMIGPALATVGINSRAGLGFLIGLLFSIVVLHQFEPQIASLGPESVPRGIAMLLFSINIAITALFVMGSMLLLVDETARSLLVADGLLLNILPASIAGRLKKSERTIADHYDNVTVVFVDLVGFTELSSKMDANSVVDLLNKVFSHFDDISSEYGLEKIKTIGDAYMAVAGAPEYVSDHAERAAQFCFENSKVTFSDGLPWDEV